VTAGPPTVLTSAMRPAIVLCVLAACYHDPAPAPVASPPASAPRVRTATQDPLGYLPVDSEIVMSLDAARLRASGLWKLVEPVVTAKVGTALDKLRTLCGVDPLRSVRQITLGFKNLGDAIGPSGVFVVRGLDRSALMACMAPLVGAAPRVTIANGVVAVAAVPGEHPAAFTFAGASTLVAVLGPTASPEALAAVIQRGAPLRGSPAFVELLGQIQTHRTAWFALNGSSQAFDKLSALGFRPTSVTGSVDLANGVTGALRMRLASEDSARALVRLSLAQLGPVKPLTEELELTSEDADVVLRVVLSEEQLASFVGIFGVFATGP
jgi:hypothetical protein